MTCYLGYNKDPRLRDISSSGGAVRGVLLDLLDNKTVDAAIVTDVYANRPTTIITADPFQTKNVSNTIYSPANPLEALKHIEKGKKYAMVGLPCHINTLKRLQGYGIGKEVVFTISLFCNHLPSEEWGKEIIRKSGELRFRGKGSPFTNSLHPWPGDKYMPETCRECYLKRVSEESDLSCGDPWFYKSNDIGDGKTVTKANTAKGQQAINDSKNVIFEECEDKTELYPLKPRKSQKEMPCYWWTCERDVVNFGDYITPLLITEFGYKPVNFDKEKHAEQLYIIGSHPYQQTSKMKIWGAGCDSENPPLRFMDNAEIYALRGKHTAEKYGVKDVPFYDPAFLMPVLFPIIKNTQDYILYIPHHSRKNIPAPEGTEIIDIMANRDNFFDILHKIVNAKKVISSSLHTQIICQAYEIPFEFIGDMWSAKFKDLETAPDTKGLIKAFPYPILNWRTLNA